jgi:transcriptional regulator with XRE-family HTH domain
MIGGMVEDPDEIPMAVLEGLMKYNNPVRAVRKAAGMSVASLAELTGLPIHRIEQFERGGATPRDDEAFVIGAATGVPSDIFIE